MSKRCVIYCRVSTDAQERSGTSLETQEQECLAYAEQQGWLVVERIKDVGSGFVLDRSGLDRARQLVRAGGTDVLLCHALDRLSRRQTHTGILVEEADECGVVLAFVTERFEDTATGQLLRSVKAFVAELEREKFTERTMRGKAQRARSGRLPQGTGKGIYGYRYDPAIGQRTIDPDQGPVVQQIFRQFCEGGSCHGIAVELNRAGLPSFGGNGWHPLTIRRMLANQTYTGTTIYRRTIAAKVRDPKTGKRHRQVTQRPEADWIAIEGATPALISMELYEQTQSILADPDRRLRGKPNQLYRLRGHVRCAACGTPMVGQALQRGRYLYYRCRRSYGGRTEGKCDSRYVSADLLESVVLEEVAMLLSDPARVLAEAARLAQALPSTGELEDLLRRLADIETQQRRLARLYTAGSLPDDVLRDESARLVGERNRLERERRELEQAGMPCLDLVQLRQRLPEVMRLLREYIINAGEDVLTLLLRAMQVEVVASHEGVQISGLVPTELPLQLAQRQDETELSDVDLVTIVRTSASRRGRSSRSRLGGSRRAARGLAFRGQPCRRRGR